MISAPALRTLLYPALCLLISMGACMEVRGQVSTNDLVRVTTLPTAAGYVGTMVGHVDGIRGNMLILRLRSRDGLIYSLPFDEVESVEVSRGVRRFTGRGALLGSLSLGVISGFAMRASNGDFFTDEEAFLTGLSLGALTGGMLGAIIGRSYSRERWSPAALPERIALSAMPVPGRGGSLSVRISL